MKKKLGRLILTDREDLIDQLKDFYAGTRTDFLVIVYNRETIDPSKFRTNDTFKLMPGERGNISDKQHKVWVEVAKHFPDIEAWVTHDYDFVCRPSDADIFRHIASDQYAMIGKAFPIWQEGMKNTNVDIYPFPESYTNWGQQRTEIPDERDFHWFLPRHYPCEFQGVKTFMGGFGDFIATSRKNILLLDDPKLDVITEGGIEQVSHSIWQTYNINPVDMRNFYKVKVLMDVVYIPMDESYDMLHPVKFWPGQKPGSGANRENLKYRIKKLIKQLIGYKGYRFRR